MKPIDQPTFDTLLASSDPFIVDFGAPWCAPCRQLDPLLESAAEEVGVKVVKIDIGQTPELSQRYGVRSVPTIIGFKNGQPMLKQVGLMSRPKLIKLLQEVREAPAR